MSPVEWHEDALNDLTSHDSWRVSQGWEPIATEIMDQVEASFVSQKIHLKQRCRVKGETVAVYRTGIEVRSKSFLVYFLYVKPRPVIRRVLHPRQDRCRVEE